MQFFFNLTCKWASKIHTREKKNFNIKTAATNPQIRGPRKRHDATGKWWHYAHLRNTRESYDGRFNGEMRSRYRCPQHKRTSKVSCDNSAGGEGEIAAGERGNVNGGRGTINGEGKGEFGRGRRG